MLHTVLQQYVFCFHVSNLKPNTFKYIEYNFCYKLFFIIGEYFPGHPAQSCYGIDRVLNFIM